MQKQHCSRAKVHLLCSSTPNKRKVGRRVCVVIFTWTGLAVGLQMCLPFLGRGMLGIELKVSYMLDKCYYHQELHSGALCLLFDLKILDALKGSVTLSCKAVRMLKCYKEMMYGYVEMGLRNKIAGEERGMFLYN